MSIIFISITNQLWAIDIWNNGIFQHRTIHIPAPIYPTLYSWKKAIFQQSPLEIYSWLYISQIMEYSNTNCVSKYIYIWPCFLLKPWISNISTCLLYGVFQQRPFWPQKGAFLNHRRSNIFFWYKYEKLGKMTQFYPKMTPKWWKSNRNMLLSNKNHILPQCLNLK